MIELTGKRFGRLTVVCKEYKNKNHRWFWKCLCDCGNYSVVDGEKLRRGTTKSCGCLRNELRKSGALKRTHGMSNERIYTEWLNMKARCNNPNNIMFKNYGGRGIQVCDEWKEFMPFAKWAKLSKRQQK